jgi:hypothetical protein
LLFFALGTFAIIVKSDLEIPESSSKFIALYLLFAIGFKGGQELSHSGFTSEIIYALLFALAISSLIPLYTFFILKRKMSISEAGAVAAAYGSVSAVTFVAASASYIAVPAAIRLAAPKADPGLYIPMAPGNTFPFNITIGMPLYYLIVNSI